jgi:hypothetical protein
MTERANVPLPGLLVGVAVAPAVALGSYLRHSRLFHARGAIVRGTARAVDGDVPERALGARLAGPVFARFSSAWWKTYDLPDVLGCALRFTADHQLSAAPRPDDQDLLLATVRHPLTTLLAPLSTDVSDFLRNHYYGVSPFRAAGLGRVKLRLSAAAPSPQADTREQRLVHALELGPVRLTLEARVDRLGAHYRPVAHIELQERLDTDDRELRFDPFASGRGLVPAGFVNAIRVAAYAASRSARAAT